MVDKVFFLDLGDDYKGTTPLCGEIFCIYVLFYNKKFFKKSFNHCCRQNKMVNCSGICSM